jgi:hypothetical protein
MSLAALIRSWGRRCRAQRVGTQDPVGHYHDVAGRAAGELAGDDAVGVLAFLAA